MSVYRDMDSGTCSGANQSPINLSQSSAKPCDQLCELVFDDAYILQANVIISDEGLILSSMTGLGSCKFNGESYSCNFLLVTHPSHHTIENIQADAEVVAIFESPTGRLCVSSLIRVNPTQNNSSHFFNAFIPYANPSSHWTSISLGEQWGLFMMVPPAGSYYFYEGSMVMPDCQPTKWCVFKSMINIDPTDFALLVKNVVPGSRPIQALGDRQVYFNDIEQLSGGPMPRDGKTYMRCKRSGRKPEVKVQKADLSGSKKTPKWTMEQIEFNDLLEIINFLILLVSSCIGLYYGWKSGPFYDTSTQTLVNGGSLFMIEAPQKWAAYLRP
jgi:carbonic anhydrase